MERTPVLNKTLRVSKTACEGLGCNSPGLLGNSAAANICLAAASPQIADPSRPHIDTAGSGQKRKRAALLSNDLGIRLAGAETVRLRPPKDDVTGDRRSLCSQSRYQGRQ
jgi:hypothetical protein